MPATLEPYDDDLPDRPPPVRRGGTGRWLVIFVLLVAIAAAVASIGQGEREDDPELAALLLTPADLAGLGDAPAKAFRRTSPPVDVDQVERAVRVASLGQAVMPRGRAVATYRRTDTGHETTNAVLVYDRPEDAVALAELADRLLPGGLGLTPQPLALDGVEDARLWTADGYRAVTFRDGDVLVLVGSTDTADPKLVLRLAEAARARVRGSAGAPTPG